MDSNIKAGTLGGTVLSSVFNLSLEDVAFTCVMASIGAVVSFFVSMSLKKVYALVLIRVKKWHFNRQKRDKLP